MKKELKPEQKKILLRQGLFVVKAAPGSGKTFSVAAKLAKELKTWNCQHQGIATLSFTNVAWKEIQRFLEEDFFISVPIKYPHFLGTIDSFINNYIFLPFGHLLLKCKKRPEMIGQPFNDFEPIGNGWYWKNHECNKYQCKLNDFSYDVHSKFTNFKTLSHFNNCKSNHLFCIKKKEEVLNNGYATQIDSNFIAMNIIYKYENIAKAIVYRFPKFIIDEAQDTSEVQMKIIDILIDNGLKEVMLIGDSDQAIYEWRTANPTLFNKKYIDWENNSVDLNINLRSSKKVCCFFSNLSSFDSQTVALNNNVKNFNFEPQIWGYQKNYSIIVDDFNKLCENEGIKLDPKNVKILSRSNDFLNRIKGKKTIKLNPWRNDENGRVGKKIAICRFLFDKNYLKESFFILEKLVISIILKKNHITKKDIFDFHHEYGYSKCRSKIYKTLNDLPQIQDHIKIKDWLKECYKIKLKILENIDLSKSIKNDRKPRFHSKFTFGDMVDEYNIDEKSDNFYANIHSIKGETFDAILLFVKERSGNNQKYEKILYSKIEENEELRNIYVAITRPRKILVITVPEKDKNIWENRFSN